MIRLLQIILTGILVSFFYFPIEFSFFPGANTKMMEAVIGLVCLAFYLIRRRSWDIPIAFLLLIASAIGVSMVALLSVTINQTPDYTYVSYIVSFSVWLSAAFAVCCLIKFVHQKITPRLVLNYLVAVCLFQCISSLVIDSNPVISRWVDTYFFYDQDLAQRVHRLYGIGSLFDVAGLRFAVVLVAIASYLSNQRKPLQSIEEYYYLIGFLLISTIGNMMARTTLVGTGVGIFVILVSFIFNNEQSLITKTHKGLTWLGLLTVTVIICIILYNTNLQARGLFRFAFEGFFSLAEKGYWEISSTEKLKTMVVWPETIHTWMIGDGYFENSRYDINYLGDATDKGFYMGTDVGYLRFIFYFGVIGLLPMMGVIVGASIICMRQFREERLLFLLALVVGLLVWFKVSTDIFLFLALFLSVAALQDMEPSPSTVPAPLFENH